MDDLIAKSAKRFPIDHLHRLALVGLVCQQWSALEFTFSVVIWHILKLDKQTGKIVTGGLDMLPRANMAINLANHTNRPPAFRNALKDARTAIQDGMDTERNRAVHGTAFLHADWSMSVEVHRGKGSRERTSLNADDLNDLAKQIYETSQALRTALRVFIPEIAEDMDRDDAMTAQMMSESGLPPDWSPK